MAEIATIARPYAEALFKAAGDQAASYVGQVQTLAAIAANAQLRQFADHPRTGSQQVFDVVSSLLREPLSVAVANFLRTVLDNGRLAALPEMAAQYQALVNARSGVSDARIESAFAMDAQATADLVQVLEKRFARKLNPTVVVRPELIGGVRVVVGDEVLDTSVAARLQNMKAALTA